jgi:NET1-associated nuclear protein 1 (U3 small nucleolar RNA-associated protein 17)
MVSNRRNRHLILPTKSHIHVYSAATSLLVRSICVDLVNSVTSCILCPSDPEHILVSTYGGTITKYNWATGRKLRKWKTRSELLRIYGLPASKSSDDGDTILAINQSSAGERDLSQYTLHHSPNVRLKEVVLRSKQKMALTIVILDDGRLFIASAGDRLILGYLQDLMSADYTWHEFTVPGKIVSFDARSRQASNTTTKTRSTVDVALGLQDGAILIYDDVLSRLIGNQKSSKGIEMISRRLYWHRDLVCSVKWSRDGALS